MKSITLLCIAAALVACVTCATIINDIDLIKSINNDASSTWTARPYKQFAGKTVEEMRKYLGAVLPVPETINYPTYTAKPTVSLPTEFDGRKAYPKCITINEIRNQANCGSCWAFSGAEVLGDRFCIATNGTFNEDLSPEYIVECDSTDYGCEGGYLDNLWRFLSRVGTVTDKCDSYVSGQGDVPECPTTCDDGSPLKFFKADPKTIKLFSKNNLEAVQEDIMKYGSIQMGFKVYQDFFSYSSGVYQHKKGGLAGGHAVKVIGWGVSPDSIPYWIVANSWGEDWGMNGTFLIKRGSNECDCETQLYSARPLLE